MTVNVAIDTVLAANDYDLWMVMACISMDLLLVIQHILYLLMVSVQGYLAIELLLVKNKRQLHNIQVKYVKMQFKPSDNLGSAHGNAYTTIGNYQNS